MNRGKKSEVLEGEGRGGLGAWKGVGERGGEKG